MKPAIAVAFIIFGFIQVYGDENDCEHLGVRLYEDLGCTPVKKDGEKCPEKFDCGDLTRPKDKCLFGGRNYELHEEIEQDKIYGACRIGCRCIKGPASYPPSGLDSKTRFNCAILDCPEWLGSPVDFGCYRKYELNKCCSVGQICPNKTKDLAKCTVDGKDYTEGQRFYPPSSCQTCVCKKDFQGKFEQPFCQKQICAVQIGHLDDVENNCAPAYFQKKGAVLCCPEDWICPTGSEEWKKSDESSSTKSDLTCKFGTKEVKYGEGFETKTKPYGTEHTVRCECYMPPLLTCLKV